MTIIITDETQSGNVQVTVLRAGGASRTRAVFDRIVEALAPTWTPLRTYMRGRRAMIANDPLADFPEVRA